MAGEFWTACEGALAVTALTEIITFGELAARVVEEAMILLEAGMIMATFEPPLIPGPPTVNTNDAVARVHTAEEIGPNKPAVTVTLATDEVNDGNVIII